MYHLTKGELVKQAFAIDVIAAQTLTAKLCFVVVFLLLT